MRAARIDRYGGAGVINVVADADRPVGAEGQLIVEVWASSLNAIDTVLLHLFLWWARARSRPSSIT